MEQLLPGFVNALNIHPMFVHFPIVFWLTALLFWIVGWLRGREDLFKFGRWLLYFGFFSSLITVGTGLWAVDQMGQDTPGHDLIHQHRNWMIAATVIGSIPVGLAFLTRKRISLFSPFVLIFLLSITNLVATLGADRGALLVYRYGIGTQAATSPFFQPQAEHENHSRDAEGQEGELHLPETSSPHETVDRPGHDHDHEH